MYDIITIGSATRDVFLESQDFKDIKSREFPSGVGECLALGSKNEVQRIFFTTGGGATNAAVTFARLGLKTACLTRVGDDDAGREIIKVLRREGVDTRFIQKDAHDNTAYSTLLMHGPGERTILVYRGASERLSLDAFRKAVSPGRVLGPKHPRRFGPAVRFGLETKWFYITSLGGRLDLIKKIWSFARANKIKIAWNPGGEELKLGWTKLLPLIKQCEVFNVNREEAGILLEAKLRVVRLRRTAEVSPRQFGQNVASAEKISLQQFLNNLCGFARITLITDGARGAHACARQEPEARGPEAPWALRAHRLLQARYKKFFVSSLGTKPRNTTGAGDAFGSGFVAGLEVEPRRTLHPPLSIESGGERRRFNLENKIRPALRLAILNADSVIRQMGAKTGILKKMPSRKEFDKIRIREL